MKLHKQDQTCLILKHENYHKIKFYMNKIIPNT